MKVGEEDKPFQEQHLELNTEGQVVICGNKVIVSEKLRHSILEELYCKYPEIICMKVVEDIG